MIYFIHVCETPRLTLLQTVHGLQADDVSFMEAEQGQIFGDVVPLGHGVLRVLQGGTRREGERFRGGK